jgi:hypothetical protein
LDAAGGERRNLDLLQDLYSSSELPSHLADMALFAVNTGCRDAEICNLLWDWEVDVPELGTSVFIIPGSRVKNGDKRVVVLNRIARSVVEARRGQHATNVFTFGCAPVKHMLNSAWKKARARADLDQVRVHDLKHTFGRRLRAAGVRFEDRQDLLGPSLGSHHLALFGGRAVPVDRGCREGVRARWRLARDGRLAGSPCDLLPQIPQRGSVPERVCRKSLISLAGELGFEPRLAESVNGI